MPRWTPAEAEAALLRAIATDDYFAACESIRRGAPPNTEVSQGWTALLRCVAGRDTGRVQALIKLGADVNHMSSKGLGQTPLVLAVSLNDLAMVRALLEHGADVNKENACALSPLTMALQLGRIDTMATYLVETACARVDDPNADGHTPLALCVVKFDLGLCCAQFLIRHGAHSTNELVQLSTQKRKHTLRRYFEEQLFASRTRDPQTISDQDERKAKDNFIRSHEEDRILEAIRKGQLSPDHQTPQGETALAFAVQHDRCLFILELVKLGATVDLQSETHGISALHEACRRGRFLAARLLLHILHADPDVLTSDGLSPLMLAAQHGHMEVVRLLLGVRAFARYKLPSGLNAKLVALGARRHDILHLLETFEQDVGSCILGSYYAPAEKADMLFLASQEALVQDYCRKASFHPSKFHARRPARRGEALEPNTSIALLKKSKCLTRSSEQLEPRERLQIMAEDQAQDLLAQEQCARQRESERRKRHKEQLLKDCGAEIAEPGEDPHRRLEDLLRQARNGEMQESTFASKASESVSLLLRPIQLQLAELLIDVLDEPEKGIREAAALLAAQKRAHATHKHDVGGHFGLQAVPTLLCLVRGSLTLGRARAARRFALTAVQECLVLDQANGSILLDTVNEASRLLVSASHADAARDLWKRVHRVQVQELGPKNRITRASQAQAERIEREKKESSRQRRRIALDRANFQMSLDPGKAWRNRLFAKSTFCAVLEDVDVGWRLFRSYALRQHCHQLVFFINAVRKALEAERQGLLICKSCNWQLAAAQQQKVGEFGNTASPMCKFCRDVPLIDAVMPQTLEVYDTFLRTPILACIPPILRKSIWEELNRGPRCFEPAVQVVMDRLYATVYPKFVRAQWRKHAGFKYVADRFMMEDPLVAARVLRIQRWKRRITICQAG